MINRAGIVRITAAEIREMLGLRQGKLLHVALKTHDWMSGKRYREPCIEVLIEDPIMPEIPEADNIPYVELEIVPGMRRPRECIAVKVVDESSVCPTCGVDKTKSE